MAISDDMSYDQWYDIFVDILIHQGYDGPVDKESFELDYENDISPEDAAKTFLEEMFS